MTLERPHVGIIQFPGVNCEYETARALESVGMEARILRWNEALPDGNGLDGFVLPGGFSYEDRVRAGAIAANENIMEHVMESAASGKPVLGICNGAQVLVESGLVPGFEAGRIDLALAPNEGMGRDGYYANWVFLKVADRPEGSFATFDLKAGEILPIPIAHCQGRFTSQDEGIFDRLEAGGQVTLTYCGSDGGEPSGFPDDPNGSERWAAAISNARGNVVAMMPHPERATWLWQVPFDLDSPWSRRRDASRGAWEKMDAEGPGAAIFRSMKRYIEERT